VQRARPGRSAELPIEQANVALGPPTGAATPAGRPNTRVRRRLDEISHEAQAAGQFGAATRCEELLGRSIGMFIDRSLQLSGQLNDSHVSALLELARKRQAEPIDLDDDRKAEDRDK
jgi:hypothetical protein